jgi:hypothetical protein
VNISIDSGSDLARKTVIPIPVPEVAFMETAYVDVRPGMNLLNCRKRCGGFHISIFIHFLSGEPNHFLHPRLLRKSPGNCPDTFLRGKIFGDLFFGIITTL